MIQPTHTHVPLSDLAIDDKVNVRRTGRGAVPIFVGSIRKRGVLQDLIVRPNGKGYKITDGGKRFEALRWLRDNNGEAAGIAVTEAYPVPVNIVQETDEVARETSLITNIAREDIHPVDRFRRFAELVEDGATPQGIADTYGLKLREVEQALALGALHPQILDAWRAGELRAEAARVFTLATDQATQLQVFTKLVKQHNANNNYAIRQALKADDQEIGHLLTFVGIEAYEARGGKVIAKDLFEGQHVVSDVTLVRAMAEEKLKAECEGMTAKGWGWAAPAAELPTNWTWQWKKLEPKGQPTDQEATRIKQLKAITEADDDVVDWNESDAAESELETINDAIRARAIGTKQMAKSGCALRIGQDGALEVTYGIIKPDNAKVGGAVETEKFAEQRRERQKKAKTEGGGAELSQALAHRLTVQLTAAAAKAICTEPDLAFAIALAALASNSVYGGDVVRIANTGMGARAEEREDEIEFAATLKAAMKMAPKARMELLARRVGSAFDFQNAPLGDPDEHPEVNAICDAIGAKAMNAALREAFDAEDYFNGVPKALCLAAITEAINADEARKVSTKPKAEIAKFAIGNVPKTGWLPPELRTRHYDGPVAKAKTKAKPAKATPKRKKAA